MLFITLFVLSIVMLYRQSSNYVNDPCPVKNLFQSVDI